MNISDNGINFIMNEEGMILHPYKDNAGVWTIGIGSTYWENGDKVKQSDKPITQDRAIKLFQTTIKRYEASVNATIKRTINQNQYDALVSLCYNIGTGGFEGSTVAKRVNSNPCDATIRDAFSMWIKSKGVVNPILVGRRKREGNLYFK